MSEKKDPLIDIKSVDFNDSSGQLPFGYFSPSDDSVYWVCNYDHQGKIVSVFAKDFPDGHREKAVEELSNLEWAEYYKNELIKDGWQELKAPEVTTTYPGEDEPRNLNRKQKRYLARKMKKLAKQNPFEEEKDNDK